MLKFLVVYDDASKRVAEWSWLLLVTFCYWIFTVSRNSWHGTARSSRCAADGTFLLWSDWFGCDFSTLWCRYGWCELMRMWMMIYVGERKFIYEFMKVTNKKSKAKKDRDPSNRASIVIESGNLSLARLYFDVHSFSCVMKITTLIHFFIQILEQKINEKGKKLL